MDVFYIEKYIKVSQTGVNHINYLTYTNQNPIQQTYWLWDEGARDAKC